MPSLDTKTHWEKVYTTKAPKSVSWYRAHVETSLALIERAAVARSAAIIDASVALGQSGVMFPASNGQPLSLNNVLTRVIQPVLTRNVQGSWADHKPDGHEYQREQSLVEWHGWHAFRRGLWGNL